MCVSLISTCSSLPLCVVATLSLCTLYNYLPFVSGQLVETFYLLGLCMYSGSILGTFKEWGRHTDRLLLNHGMISNQILCITSADVHFFFCAKYETIAIPFIVLTVLWLFSYCIIDLGSIFPIINNISQLVGWIFSIETAYYQNNSSFSWVVTYIWRASAYREGILFHLQTTTCLSVPVWYSKQEATWQTEPHYSTHSSESRSLSL